VNSKTNAFFKGITRFDRSAFSLSTGVRASIFAIAPLVGALAFHQPLLIFATLGAIFLTNTEGQPSVAPWWVLLVACFTEAAALGLGTLAATTGLLSPVFLGIAVSVVLLARVSPRWAATGTFTAITFAVGAGIPGASIEEAALRLSSSLSGALLALLGVGLHRLVLSHRHRAGQTNAPVGQPMTRSEALRSAVLLGILSALGFAIGFVLGLPRDFWVVITLIISVRPSLSLTVSFTLTMAVGTIIGALIAAEITLETSDVYVLVPLMFAFAVLMFASRGVNVGLVQIFLVPFIIILLNIIYPGEWYLAFYRVLEVAIGIVLSIIAVYLLSVRKRSSGLESGKH
jgi:hypothetical protein